MDSTTKGTAIEELSAYVLDTGFEDFDRETMDNAKTRIIDTVGCLIGGANAPGNSALVDLVKGWGGREEATILIHGGKAPAHNVAMVNCIMVRSFDFGALGPSTGGPGAHICETTVMTTLTMGEVVGINGKELISALLLGDDVILRVLAARGSASPFALGWAASGTVNTFGATAIAGRLLGLNKLQLRNAFGIALNQLAGSFQSIWDGTTAFKLNQGVSARNGIFSAELAKTGWTGPEDALLSRLGFYALYTEGCNKPEILTKDIGKKYYSNITFKPYPSCRGNHPAIDCVLALVSKHDIVAEDIEEVTLCVPRRSLDGFLGQPFRIGDFPHGNAIFNYQYNVASALLRKSVKPEHFTEQSIRDPQVNALIGKIKLAELLTAERLGCELKVRMRDGREFSEFTDAPKGDPVRNPMSKDEIIAKFRANVDFSQTVTKENAERLLGLLENLEELENINKIVELLV